MQSGAYFTKKKVFLLIMRSWCHHEGISCFPRHEEMQGLGSWNQFLKISKIQFPWSTRCPILHPDFPAGVLKVSNCSSSGFSLSRCRWQMPLLLLSCWQMLLASAKLWLPVLAWTIPIPEEPVGLQRVRNNSWGRKESGTTELLSMK